MSDDEKGYGDDSFEYQNKGKEEKSIKSTFKDEDNEILNLEAMKQEIGVIFKNDVDINKLTKIKNKHNELEDEGHYEIDEEKEIDVDEIDFGREQGSQVKGEILSRGITKSISGSPNRTLKMNRSTKEDLISFKNADKEDKAESLKENSLNRKGTNIIGDDLMFQINSIRGSKLTKKNVSLIEYVEMEGSVEELEDEENTENQIDDSEEKQIEVNNRC
jgi:hypothetical protein